MKPLLKLILLALLYVGAANAQHKVTLTWDWAPGLGGDLATGYHILRSQVPTGPFGTIGTVTDVNIKTFLDIGVIGGQTYYYAVTAFNTGGDSTLSNISTCVVPFQAPQAPSKLQGSVI